uniref:ATP synthase F0 subunit 8 n=1 Tax=Limassolla lingchuanensis TaxID=2704520 RepID=UPI0013E99B97|nr:ATP synthase F0 subunit 8 [Limassolla lingchuanensis]QHR79703.1 ATP synthase F0 subunit 8 [Limassolla lingchuanensis]
MPQMSPMLWVYLSMLFILTMIMSINIMYFNYSNQINKDIKTHKKMMNWVW